MRYCAICELKLFKIEDPNDPWAETIDHNYPVSTHPHLENVPWNQKPAHRWCNSVKGDQTMKEFRESPDHPLSEAAFEQMKEDGAISKSTEIEELMP